MKDAEFVALAIDDVRVRHQALLGLLLQSDQQALSLLQLYVTLAVATSAGAAAVLWGDEWPHELGWGLIGATIALVAGAMFCIRAVVPAKVGLPGRDAMFWAWATDDRIDAAEAVATYLKAAQTSIELNRDLNAKTAKLLGLAKGVGAAAPVVAFVMAGGAYWLSTLVC